MNSGASAKATAEALSGGILDTIKAIDHSILSIGLSLVTIKTEKLFKELGFRHMSAYVFYLAAQSKRDRSSIYKWLQIGEIYIKYQAELEKAGFSGNDSPTKLPYLERALMNNPKDEVFINIKEMTQRAFSAFAKSSDFANAGDFALAKSNDFTKAPDISKVNTFEMSDSWGHSFFYRGIEAARVNKILPRRIYSMLVPAIRLSFNALDRRSYVVAVHLENYQEYIRFSDIAVKAREDMRVQMRTQMRSRLRLERRARRK